MTPQITFTLVSVVIMFILMVTEIIPLPATMALEGLALYFSGVIEDPTKLYSNWGGSTIMFLILMSIIVDTLTQTGIVQDMSANGHIRRPTG